MRGLLGREPPVRGSPLSPPPSRGSCPRSRRRPSWPPRGRHRPPSAQGGHRRTRAASCCIRSPSCGCIRCSIWAMRRAWGMHPRAPLRADAPLPAPSATRRSGASRSRRARSRATFPAALRSSCSCRRGRGLPRPASSPASSASDMPWTGASSLSSWIFRTCDVSFFLHVVWPASPATTAQVPPSIRTCTADFRNRSHEVCN